MQTITANPVCSAMMNDKKQEHTEAQRLYDNFCLAFSPPSSLQWDFPQVISAASNQSGSLLRSRSPEAFSNLASTRCLDTACGQLFFCLQQSKITTGEIVIPLFTVSSTSLWELHDSQSKVQCQWDPGHHDQGLRTQIPVD